MSRGNWRIINSWWILITFTLYFNWAAFFYTGITAKNRKWIFYGLIYAIPLILYQVFPSEGPNPDITSYILGLFVLFWLISIIHAFLIRKEYLIRLETLKKYGDNKEEVLREKIENEFKQGKISNQNPQKSNNIPHSSLTENTSKTKLELVDINNDSEQVIAKLPGIGTILAKRAIEIRQTRDFESAEDFGQALDLKPHIIEQIRPLLIINPSNRNFEPETSGRRVDF